MKSELQVSTERIEGAILLVRDVRVMLDEDLALLFGVTTARLNQQVKRNLDRFPADFMFQLTKEEWDDLRSQFATSSLKLQSATSKPGRGGRRKRPYAFTEHGVVMLANVLNSPTAVRASIQVVRAFVHLREWLAAHKELAGKLKALETKYDGQFKVVFDAIRQLMSPPDPPKRRPIGFRSEGGKGSR